MELYDRPKSPGETIDYAYDWLASNDLADGETISSVSVSFTDTGGTSNPSTTKSDTITRVWLSGGTHGRRATFTVTIITNAGRTIDQAFGVDIVNKITGPTVETDVAKLERYITEAEAARHKLMMGADVVDVWRDGKRMRFQKVKLAELNDYIAGLKAQLTTAQIAAGVAPTARRRAISLAWRG